MIHECDCPYCTVETDPPPPQPNPPHPITGEPLDSDEWIRLWGYRARAEKVGFPVPQKWMVPKPSMMFVTSHYLKSIYLPAVREALNAPSPLLRYLR